MEEKMAKREAKMRESGAPKACIACKRNPCPLHCMYLEDYKAWESSQGDEE